MSKRNVVQRPYPDYVVCPHCGEPEVEVWCYDPTAQCHACGRTFQHALPVKCADHCDRTACPADVLPASNKFDQAMI
jgi:transcription elongation factor Elf1